MTYKYKVSLPGIKGFYRIYKLRPDTTLFHFHNTMRSDMDFPQNQIVLFKAVNPADGKAVSRYSSVDLGKGTIDAVTVGQLHKAGEDNFVYFYDTTNAKSVLLNFMEECPDMQDAKVVLDDTKGPNPIEFENGYVAFEDLPKEKQIAPSDDGDDDIDDDIDDDDDEAGDDGEDGKEIYSEDEE